MAGVRRPLPGRPAPRALPSVGSALAPTGLSLSATADCPTPQRWDPAGTSVVPILLRRPLFLGFATFGVDGFGGGPYIGSIDGGAAGCGPRVSTLPSFGLVVYARQGLPGVSSSSLSGVMRRADVWGSLCGVPRCLTISSEERETWTAVSLRSAFGRTRRLCAARELHRRSRFQIHRASVWLSGLAGADVFGTRRVCSAFGLNENCDQSGLGFRVFYNLRV